MKYLALLLLWALPAAAQVTSPYWPMPGWCEYHGNAITGIYHPDTMELDVWTRVPHPEWDRRHTFIPVPVSLIPTMALVITPAGTPAPANWMGTTDTLAESLWTTTGKDGWLGEVGTFGAHVDYSGVPTVMIPPEAELPVDPASMMVASTHTTAITIYTNGVASQSSLIWKFRNLGVGKGLNNTWWWAEYPNQLRTTLEERPDTNMQTPDYDTVYGYLWAKGMGPIDVWWGTRAKDNTVSGYEWTIIGCGH